MKRTILTVVTTVVLLSPAAAQDERRWALSAGIGGTTMDEASYYEVNGSEGNYFHVTADYYLTDRWALSGGLYLEHNGVLGSCAYDGLGLMTYNMMGVQAGAKYYFFPKRWVVQPYVGAMLVTNVLNLSHQRGRRGVAVTSYGDTRGALDYDIQCPALSVAPRLGVDVHLFSSVSLMLEWQYRYAFWGQANTVLDMTEGQRAGTRWTVSEPMSRQMISIGVKMDFPVKPVSQRAFNNLLQVLGGWIESRAGY